jgi:hypothetical protein
MTGRNGLKMRTVNDLGLASEQIPGQNNIGEGPGTPKLHHRLHAMKILHCGPPHTEQRPTGEVGALLLRTITLRRVPWLQGSALTWFRGLQEGNLCTGAALDKPMPARTAHCLEGMSGPDDAQCTRLGFGFHEPFGTRPRHCRVRRGAAWCGGPAALFHHLALLP